LLDTLGEQGYRSTSPRKAVTQAIAAKQGHFTAEQLRQQLPGVATLKTCSTKCRQPTDSS